MSAKCAPVRSAASGFATTTTSAAATRSSATPASRSRGAREAPMPREIPRARRVAEQVQRTLSGMLHRDVRDPRFKPVTITHVRMSPDLAHAWVHFAPLSGDARDPVQREILDEAASYLRGP